MFYNTLITFLVLFGVTTAETLDNIFTGLEITQKAGVPSSSWVVEVDYEFPNTSLVNVGDTFQLIMPYVYRLKFSDGSSSISASYNDTEIFTCDGTNGAYFLDYSYLDCKVAANLSSIADALKGYIQFSVYFGDGGSIHSVDLDEANHWTIGENIVIFNDVLSDTVTFTGVEDSDGVYTYAHTTGYDTVQEYILFPPCSDEQDFNAQISFSGGDEVSTVICDSLQVFITNDLNDWLFPKSYEKASYSSYFCSSSFITITNNEIPAGYRVFVSYVLPLGSETEQISVTINYDQVCKNSTTTSSIGSQFKWNLAFGARTATEEVIPIHIETISYEGTTTSMTILRDGVTATAETILIYTPIPTTSWTTITSYWGSYYTSTSSDLDEVPPLVRFI